MCLRQSRWRWSDHLWPISRWLSELTLLFLQGAYESFCPRIMWGWWGVVFRTEVCPPLQVTCIQNKANFPFHQSCLFQFSSVQFICSVVSDSLQPHEPQHARLPCPSSTPGVYPNSCPLSRWCHPAISSSVVPFSSCPQSFPASGSFQMSQLFASGGQSTGVSASTSVLPMQ